jgi:hypothetical protein
MSPTAITVPPSSLVVPINGCVAKALAVLYTSNSLSLAARVFLSFQSIVSG